MNQAVQKVDAVLLRYQQKWIGDKADVKLCEKSRRVGLSWGEAEDATEIAARSKAAGGMDYWYIGYNKDMAQEFIRDVAGWAKGMNAFMGEIEEEVIKDEDKDILTFVIKFSSGFRVTALSSRPSNLRGKQGVVCIDEAAFHEDLAGLIKAAMALLMWGGKVRIISTHNGDTNLFNDLIQDALAGKKPYSVHTITFKEALKQGLYKRICLVRGIEWTQAGQDDWTKTMYDFYGDDAAEELDVIPTSGAGTYLPRLMIESVMQTDIPVVRLSLPAGFEQQPERIRVAEINDWLDEYIKPLLVKLNPNQRHYFGEDFARNGDLTALWPLAELQNLNLHTPFVVELRNVPFEQQKQIVFYIIERLPRFVAGAMDARGNGQYLAEVTMQKFGATRIAQVMLSQEWYRNNMPRFKAAFEDQSINAPKDADVMADMRCVKMDKGVAKVPDTAKVRGADGKDRHGDTAIALALALFAVKTLNPAAIEYQAATDTTYTETMDDMGDDFTFEGGGAW